jgi:hypothetical protein
MEFVCVSSMHHYLNSSVLIMLEGNDHCIMSYIDQEKIQWLRWIFSLLFHHHCYWIVFMLQDNMKIFDNLISILNVMKTRDTHQFQYYSKYSRLVFSQFTCVLKLQITWQFQDIFKIFSFLYPSTMSFSCLLYIEAFQISE